MLSKSQRWRQAQSQSGLAVLHYTLNLSVQKCETNVFNPPFCCCSGRFQEYSEQNPKGLQRHVCRWAPRFNLGRPRVSWQRVRCGSSEVVGQVTAGGSSSKGSLQTSTFSSGCDFILTCNLSPGPDSAFRIPLVVHTQHVQLPHMGTLAHVLFIIIRVFKCLF